MYIKNTISEYDIEHANISILLAKGVFDKKEYDKYVKMNKKTRNVKIGLLIKENKHIYDVIQDGFKEYIEEFILQNKLDPENNIVEINHDAVWVTGRLPTKTQFDNVVFRQKQTYTSYYGIKIKGNIFKIYINTLTDEYGVRNFTPNNLEIFNELLDILRDYEYEDNEKVYERLHSLLRQKVPNINYDNELIPGIKNDTIFKKMIKDLI